MKTKLEALLCFAGWLPPPSRFSEVSSSLDEAEKNTVMLQHCCNDETISVEFGHDDTLPHVGMIVDWYEYREVGHCFNEPEGIDVLVRFARGSSENL